MSNQQLNMTRVCFSLLLIFSVFSITATAFAGAPKEKRSQLPAIKTPAVRLERVPDQGIQPRVIRANNGDLHLIYFVGKIQQGQIKYRVKKSGQKSWSKSFDVTPSKKMISNGGVIAQAHMRLSDNGTVYVSWFDRNSEALFFSYGNAANGFSSPLDILNDVKSTSEKSKKGIEVSAAIADHGKLVYLFWHAGDPKNDASRQIFMRVSKDRGKTFSDPKAVSSIKVGACGCCGLNAYADSKGTVYVAYRSARKNKLRDLTLLTSQNEGKDFHTSWIDFWELEACPVTTMSFAERSSDVLLTWETKGVVRFKKITNKDVAALRHQKSPSLLKPTTKGWMSSVRKSKGNKKRQKNSSLIENAQGVILVSWGEGFGWASGGTLTWQLFGPDSTSLKFESSKLKIPRLSTAVSVLDGQGGFVIFY